MWPFKQTAKPTPVKKEEEEYVPVFARDALKEKKDRELKEALEIENRKRNGTYYPIDGIAGKDGFKYLPRECEVCSSAEPLGYREYTSKCERCTVCNKVDLDKCIYVHQCHICHYQQTHCSYCTLQLKRKLKWFENPVDYEKRVTTDKDFQYWASQAALIRKVLGK